MSKTSKRYKCPYCEYRHYRDKLILHVEEDHEDMIPKDYTPSRVVYNTINKREHGTCMICHSKTEWDENKQRYNTLCGNPKCKTKYVEIVRSRMVKKYGTHNLLNDPEFQKKMLENRSISGKYKFEDGGSIGYVGSYEKKFLEFMDKFLHIKSYDIISPGPNIPYMYKGKEHVWITDFLYEPYNLVFDIKDGGDNPNTRSMEEYREKQIAKEKAIAEYGEYNYIRLTDNKFEQLISIFMELKEKEEHTKPLIRINESSILEGELFDALMQDINTLRNKKKNKEKEEIEANNIKNNLKELGEQKFHKLLKEIQLDILSYLKKYSNTSEFKSKYKDQLYMIKIVPQNYGDPYSVEITSYQDGVDDEKAIKWEKQHPGHDNDWYNKNNPYCNPKWYDELLNAGIAYGNKKYEVVFKKYGIYLNTANGDEGNIYICCKYKFKNNEVIRINESYIFDDIEII